MILSLTEQRKVIGEAELTFCCKTCATSNRTDVFRFKTVDKWLGLVPVWVTYETVAKCPKCDATVRSNYEIEELLGLSPEEMGDKFNVRIGFVEKFLVIAGWALIITGPVAFLLFLIARFMVPKAASPWRKSTNIGMIVSALILPAILLVAAIADLIVWIGDGPG